jgi:hypothetical protein
VLGRNSFREREFGEYAAPGPGTQFPLNGKFLALSPHWGLMQADCGPSDGDGMTTNVTRLLSAAAVAAALVPAAASAAGAADLPNPKVTSDGPNSTIVVHAHRTGGTFTPDGGAPTKTFPTAAPKAGDGFTFVDDLIQNGAKIGTDRGRCTIKAANAATCDATLMFADGSLHSSGASPQSSGPYSVPISAGTGAFSGATGTAHVVPVAAADKYTESDVTLTFAVPAAATSGTGSSSSSSGAGTSSPQTGGSQVTTVPKGGAATGTGSTAAADDSWLVLLGTTGIVAAGAMLLASRRSRRVAR